MKDCVIACTWSEEDGKERPPQSKPVPGIICLCTVLTFGFTPACNLTLGSWRYHILLRRQTNPGHMMVQSHRSLAGMGIFRNYDHRASPTSNCLDLSTYLSNLSRTSWEPAGPQTVLATGTFCRFASPGCEFWLIVPNHTSYPVRGSRLGERYSARPFLTPSQQLLVPTAFLVDFSGESGWSSGGDSRKRGNEVSLKTRSLSPRESYHDQTHCRAVSTHCSFTRDPPQKCWLCLEG